MQNLNHPAIQPGKLQERDLDRRQSLRIPRIEDLAADIEYQPQTGSAVWKRDMSKSAKAGDAVGGMCKKGYLVTKWHGVQLKVHRVVFALFHGRWPAAFVDHINGCRTDNRIANLRDANRNINRQNIRAPQANNTTGYLGVVRRRNRFAAQIQCGDKWIHLGTYDTAEHAHASYLTAKRSLHEGNTL